MVKNQGGRFRVGYRITTRQLAGHLAGIRDYREDDTENLHYRFRSLGYPIGALTYVEGIKTKGAFGETSARLTFVREESGPMITDLQIVASERRR